MEAIKVKKSCAELDKNEEEVVYKTRSLFQLSDNLFYFIPKVNKRIAPEVAKVYVKAGKEIVVYGGLCNVEELQNLVKQDDSFSEERYTERLITRDRKCYVSLLEIAYISAVCPEMIDKLTTRRNNFMEANRERDEREERERREKKEKKELEKKEHDMMMWWNVAGKVCSRQYEMSSEEVLVMEKITGYKIPLRTKGWIKKNLKCISVNEGEKEITYTGNLSSVFFTHFDNMIEIAKKVISGIVTKGLLTKGLYNK